MISTPIAKAAADTPSSPPNRRRPSIRRNSSRYYSKEHHFGNGEPSSTPQSFRHQFDVTNTMDRLRLNIAGDFDVSESADQQSGTGIAYTWTTAASQIPAILLIAMFHLLIGIPFGVSYFPVSWTNSDDSSHSFPLPDKDALGIRMFLLSTIVGQVVFNLQSGFVSPIGLQMVENVPFCHALAQTVFRHQGYGLESLSTLLVMFGLSSIIVGALFLVLGKLNLGRVVHYFPAHVLVGCIGGIGLFIAKTGIEVTTNRTFGIQSIAERFDLILPVLCYEVLLRVLERWNRDRHGRSRFPLLFPIYFCMVTPVFYFFLFVIGVSPQTAAENGYFFPALVSSCVDEGVNAPCSSSLVDAVLAPEVFDMWRAIDFSRVSWTAIGESTPTLIALTLFSLIHVPINIPAFSISSGVDVDMNQELIAHGYSNICAGCLGGLQNYMAYTQSVLFDKSGGRGKTSGMSVAVLTSLLFLLGPSIASYIPRCMAGALLLHVGADLFLEGVYDSIGKFDKLEYTSIWFIAAVMTLFGMEAAMLAGAISAVATHAVQSIHYVNPVRGAMSAVTLRSSHWNRGNAAQELLDDKHAGRGRIFVVQLQGHLFFGNTARLTENLNDHLSRQQSILAPWILIIDFSLVLGIDSSAAQALVKLSNSLRKNFRVYTVFFVTGSEDGFPAEFDLTSSLLESKKEFTEDVPANEETPLVLSTGIFAGSMVEESLDGALLLAEDALLLHAGVPTGVVAPTVNSGNEREIALMLLSNLAPEQARHEVSAMETLFSCFRRELYHAGDIVWKQGASSNSLKLLLRGELVSVLEDEAGTTESISAGNTIGELGLLQGLPRMSSVHCVSSEAIVYSLDRDAFQDLFATAPQAARIVDLICIRYLAARVQHVSNRIFETRCLPI